MMNPLATPQDYELFIYSLHERNPEILSSTLVFRRIGTTIAKLAGEVVFKNEYRLQIRELLIFDRTPGVIEAYGYASPLLQ